MKFKLVAAVDEEVTGELLWKDRRIASNSPYGPIGGFGLIHDCFEHFKLETVADEIEAHGAIYWGRYLGGYCYPNSGRNLTLENIAAEWTQLGYAMASGHDLSPCRRTVRLDGDTEGDMVQIISMGRIALASEELSQFGNEIAAKFAGHFRTGIRKAKARYEKMGWSQAEVAHHYAEAISRYEKVMPEFPGQEMLAILDCDGFRLQEVYPEDTI